MATLLPVDLRSDTATSWAPANARPPAPWLHRPGTIGLAPDRDSEVLTRELLYTALTRARGEVRIWGRRDVFARAAARRTVRPSGLGEKVWGCFSLAIDVPLSRLVVGVVPLWYHAFQHLQ